MLMIPEGGGGGKQSQTRGTGKGETLAASASALEDDQTAIRPLSSTTKIPTKYHIFSSVPVVMNWSRKARVGVPPERDSRSGGHSTLSPDSHHRVSLSKLNQSWSDLRCEYDAKKRQFERLVFPSAHPSRRVEVFLLAKTLDTMIAKLTEKRTDLDPVAQAEAASRDEELFGIHMLGLDELSRQVETNSVERCALLRKFGVFFENAFRNCRGMLLEAESREREYLEEIETYRDQQDETRSSMEESRREMEKVLKEKTHLYLKTQRLKKLSEKYTQYAWLDELLKREKVREECRDHLKELLAIQARLTEKEQGGVATSDGSYSPGSRSSSSSLAAGMSFLERRNSGEMERVQFEVNAKLVSDIITGRLFDVVTKLAQMHHCGTPTPASKHLSAVACLNEIVSKLDFLLRDIRTKTSVIRCDILPPEGLAHRKGRITVKLFTDRTRAEVDLQEKIKQLESERRLWKRNYNLQVAEGHDLAEQLKQKQDLIDKLNEQLEQFEEEKRRAVYDALEESKNRYEDVIARLTEQCEEEKRQLTLDVEAESERSLEDRLDTQRTMDSANEQHKKEKELLEERIRALESDVRGLRHVPVSAGESYGSSVVPPMMHDSSGDDGDDDFDAESDGCPREGEGGELSGFGDGDDLDSRKNDLSTSARKSTTPNRRSRRRRNRRGSGSSSSSRRNSRGSDSSKEEKRNRRRSRTSGSPSTLRSRRQVNRELSSQRQPLAMSLVESVGVQKSSDESGDESPLTATSRSSSGSESRRTRSRGGRRRGSVGVDVSDDAFGGGGGQFDVVSEEPSRHVRSRSGGRSRGESREGSREDGKLEGRPGSRNHVRTEGEISLPGAIEEFESEELDGRRSGTRRVSESRRSCESGSFSRRSRDPTSDISPYSSSEESVSSISTTRSSTPSALRRAGSVGDWNQRRVTFSSTVSYAPGVQEDRVCSADEPKNRPRPLLPHRRRHSLLSRQRLDRRHDPSLNPSHPRLPRDSCVLKTRNRSAMRTSRCGSESDDEIESRREILRQRHDKEIRISFPCDTSPKSLCWLLRMMWQVYAGCVVEFRNGRRIGSTSFSSLVYLSLSRTYGLDEIVRDIAAAIVKTIAAHIVTDRRVQIFDAFLTGQWTSLLERSADFVTTERSTTLSRFLTMWDLFYRTQMGPLYLPLAKKDIAVRPSRTSKVKILYVLSLLRDLDEAMCWVDLQLLEEIVRRVNRSTRVESLDEYYEAMARAGYMTDDMDAPSFDCEYYWGVQQEDARESILDCEFFSIVGQVLDDVESKTVFLPDVSESLGSQSAGRILIPRFDRVPRSEDLARETRRSAGSVGEGLDVEEEGEMTEDQWKTLQENANELFARKDEDI